MIAEPRTRRWSLTLVTPLPVWVGLAIGLALVALASRPVGLAGVGVTAIAALIGLMVPLPGQGSRQAALRTWLLVTVVGLAAFGIARATVVGAHPQHVPVWGAVVTVAAGIGEEALFRRLLYGWLARWGAITAILASAVLFALIHVPGYGVGAFGVDLAAGILFGWQRWAAGTWSAPAVTHAAANLMQLL
ncbi:MAG: lysostaphin resistance A-like protein [Actinomycetota bacterium]